ncbi:MAG TPA: glycosyltransferase family 39 protein, partial [Anaerolineae bacterium]
MIIKSIQTKLPPGSRWVKFTTLITLIIIVAVPRVLPFPHSFLTYDELKIGVQVSGMARALLAGDWLNTANSPYPAVTLAWIEAIQVGLAHILPGLSLPSAQNLPDLNQYAFASLARWRITLALVNTAIILALFWLLRQLYNNFVALTATLLMTLDPFLLTEARTFRTEGLTTGLMMLSALTIILYAKERRTRWLAGSGLLAGLAILTRISAFFMLPFVGLVLLTWPMLTGQRNVITILKQTTRDVFLWSLVAGCTIIALWPALWASPLDAFRTLQGYLRPAVGEASRVWKKGVFFRGRTWQDVDPGLQFYLWALAYRTTPVMEAGLIAALTGGLMSLFRSNREAGSEADFDGEGLARPSTQETVPVASTLNGRRVTWLVLAYCFFYVVSLNLTVIKIDRYLIAVFPALAILAAVGFQGLIDFFAYPARVRRLAQVAVWGGVLAASAWFSLPHHPYYYTYWNPLLGGGQAAVKELPAMGRQGVDVLVDYLNGLPNARDLNLAGTGLDLDYVQECPLVFAGTCSWYPDFLASDYFLMSIYSAQNDVYLANVRAVVPDVEVARAFTKDGVTYAWLYKMPVDLQSVGYWLDLSGGSFSGYRLSTTELGAGDSLEATLFWQNGEKSGWRFDDSELFITVLDENGQIQQTVPAQLKPEFMSYLSQANEILVFTAPIDFPADSALGVYTLEMGLRLKATAETTVKFPLAATANTVRINRGALVTSGEKLNIQYRLDNVMDGTGLTLLGYDVDGPFSSVEEDVSAPTRPPQLKLY